MNNTIINNKEYDFTKFKHPGGERFMSYAYGVDATELYLLHHKNNPKLLEKFYVKDIDQCKEQKSYNLRQEIINDFNKPLKLSNKKYYEYIIVTHMFFIAYILSFIGMIYYKSYLLTSLYSVFNWLVVSNIMHHASHGSLFKSQFLNTIYNFISIFSGYSSFAWDGQHIYSHHTVTNEDNDHDSLSKYPLLITNPNNTKNKKNIHKFQHLYAPILYSFSLMSFWFVDIIGILNNFKVYKTNIQYRTTKLRCIFECIIAKICLFCIIYINYHFNGLKFCFISNLLHIIILSNILSYTFIINHETTDINFISSNDIAYHQISNTCNYKASYLWSYFHGFLNYQIEHHLFPSLHPLLYSEISNSVQKVCKKHNINYISLNNFFEGISEHFRHLYIMGNS